MTIKEHETNNARKSNQSDIFATNDLSHRCQILTDPLLFFVVYCLQLVVVYFKVVFVNYHISSTNSKRNTFKVSKISSTHDFRLSVNDLLSQLTNTNGQAAEIPKHKSLRCIQVLDRYSVFVCR